MSSVVAKYFVFCAIWLMTCAFNPADIVFKNLKLIPDPIDKTDRYPHLPENYTDVKNEKLWNQKKFPTVKSDKPADDVVSVKKIINETIRTTPEDLVKGLTPTMESVDYMFNLSNIGINTKSNNKDNEAMEIGFLETETAKLPILNDMPGMSYLYNKKTPVVKSIEGVQVPGLDDVLPTKVGQPLSSNDYDIQPHLDFFTDYITPDQVLDQSIFDVIP